MSTETELTVIDKPKHVNVIRVLNPFDARERQEEVWELTETKSLRELFPVVQAEHVVSINGLVVIDDEDNFQKHYVQPGDSLVVCPVPLGGGDSKGILRIIAMIVVMVVAWYFAPAVAGFMGVSEAVAMAGMTMIGGMAVNALLPPQMPGNFAREALENSSSYGVDGQKNTAVEGIPVPVVYGEFRVAGNYIQLYTANVDSQTQELKILLCVSEGPIEAIDQIELNDQPLENFKDVEIAIRTGTPSQTMIPWFDDIILPRNVNLKMTTSYSNFVTLGIVDRLRFDIAFPLGLSSIDTQSGNRLYQTVDVEIQVRKVGTTTWQTVGRQDTFTGYNYRYFYYTYTTTPGFDGNDTRTQTGVQEGPLISGDVAEGSDAQNPEAGGRIVRNTSPGGDNGPNFEVMGYWTATPQYQMLTRFTNNTGSAYRVSVDSGPLQEGMYEIRWRRITEDATSDQIFDDVFMVDINEIQVEDVAYNNTALLGIKIRLTDQLNNIPKVTYRVRGRQVKVYDETNKQFFLQQRWSNNPAWIVYDMLTNRRFGAGISEARIDLVKFRKWAKFCDDEGLTFDGTFDASMNVWDALNHVCRAGHAAPMMIGTRFTVAIEMPSTPVMMFSVANMKKGSFRQSWLPVSERANEIEVNYFDKEAKYVQKSVRVTDESAMGPDNEIKSTSITLIGVTDLQRAYKEGRLLLNMNKYILQTVEFEAPAEALACTVGDLIYVQHDMPQWGYAGRCEAGSTTSVINLDREVPFDGAKLHKLLIVFDSVLVHTGTGGTPIGNVIPISGVTADMSIKRIKWATHDVEVQQVQSGSVTIGAFPSGSYTSPAGQSIQCWDTDYIAERDVVSVSGGKIVTVSAPLPAAPAVFQHWMYGESTKVKKPFRVKSITATTEVSRKIGALEYNASVYDDDGVVVPTPNYSDLDTEVKHVTINGVTEELVNIAGTIITRVTLTWRPQQETYAGAHVYVTRGPDNGSNRPTEYLGMQRDKVTVIANDDEVLKFMVVAYDSMGAQAPAGSAPTYTHTTVGKTAPPANVTGFVVTNTNTGPVLQWNAVPDLDLRGYEIRVGATWAAGTVLVQNFQGTQFQDVRRSPGTYNYMIRAIDTRGTYSVETTTFSLSIAGLPAVSGLTGQNTINGPLLNWTAINNDILKGYDIRLGSNWDTATILVADYTGNAYFDRKRVPGTYTYLVRAKDIFGNYSAAASVNVAIANIAAPTGVNADPRINDILLTWNAVIDTDLKGYEIRLGTSWDSAQVLITNYGGNSFTDTKRPAGTYTYLVRSIGTLGNYSDGIGTFTLTLTPPQSVAGFDCVQNGDRIEFRWDQNPEADLIGYELREGPSWGAGVTIVELLGTTFTLPAQSISGSRTFWIKAIREPGIESVSAVFSTTAIANPTDRNLILTSDQAALGFTGVKINTSVVDGKLVLNAGQTYGEYLFGVTLPTTYRARNSLLSTFDAIIPDTTTWASATYQWNSAQAQRGWAISGDTGSIGLQFYIAKYTGLPAGQYIEGFTLNNTTTGEYGTVASSPANITYAPARFFNGVRVQATTVLQWNLTVASSFNLTFWALAEVIPASGLQVFWKGTTAGGAWLDLSWNVATQRFELRDNSNNIIQVAAPGTYAVNDRVFFGVVQTASQRRLYVGILNKGTAQGSANLTPIGTLTSIKMHP